jgi:hypothetical protein
VTEVGFIESDFGGFGCSPDGLIYATESYDRSANVQVIEWIPTHGLEIKCPMPETHLAWLDDGILPGIHELQVHACMAVTQLDRWDFLSFCPGQPSLLLEVHRSELTERLESGLKVLVAEKAKMKSKLAAMWQAEFGKGEG